MDGDMPLEFSGPQFRSISSTETAAIRFLNGLLHAPISPELNNSQPDSRDAIHHTIASVPSNEINHGVGDNMNDVADIHSSISSLTEPAVHYHECMKNHAAALGGHSVDGCGEFSPSGCEGLDAFMCAACSCHRNFHRKEVEGSTQGGCDVCHKDPRRFAIGPPTPALVAAAPNSSHMMVPVNFPHLDDPSAYTDGLPLHKRRRRHRTIFSLEQKEKMFFFAESLGWKILKHDEDSVQSFCNDVGVPRHIFRVWMHNHKQNMKRRSVEPDSN